MSWVLPVISPRWDPTGFKICPIRIPSRMQIRNHELGATHDFPSMGSCRIQNLSTKVIITIPDVLRLKPSGTFVWKCTANVVPLLIQGVFEIKHADSWVRKLTYTSDFGQWHLESSKPLSDKKDDKVRLANAKLRTCRTCVMAQYGRRKGLG